VAISRCRRNQNRAIAHYVLRWDLLTFLRASGVRCPWVVFRFEWKQDGAVGKQFQKLGRVRDLVLFHNPLLEEIEHCQEHYGLVRSLMIANTTNVQLAKPVRVICEGHEAEDAQLAARRESHRATVIDAALRAQVVDSLQEKSLWGCSGYSRSRDAGWPAHLGPEA
jgi:hypothetical protein